MCENFHNIPFCFQFLMSSQHTGKLLGLIGAFFLAHSAYSTYERMSPFSFFEVSSETFSLDLAYIKAVDEINAALPVEVMAYPVLLEHLILTSYSLDCY